MIPLSTSLRSEWLVAGLSSEVKHQPVSRTILETPLVLFRSHGVVASLLDRCPHRNAALSAGRMAGDLLECPYHGWAFDGAGTCRRIPGMKDSCDHTHQRAQAVTTLERDGLVWVNLGATSGRPAPDHRHSLPGDQRFDRFFWAATADCAFVDGVENLLDACHPHFAHAGLLRRTKKRRPVEVSVKRTAEGVEVVYAENHRAEGLIPRLLEGQRLTSIGRYFPTGIAQLEYRGPRGPQFILTSYFTPRDERSVSIYSVIATPRQWAPAFLKETILRWIFGRVLRQDQDVLRAQQANIDRFGGPAFTSTPLDVMRPHILYFLNHPTLASRSDYATSLIMEL